MRPQDEACEALCCIPPSFPSVTPCDKAEPQKGGCEIKSGQPSLTDLGEAIRETGMVRGERVGAAGHCLLYSRQEDQNCSEYQSSGAGGTRLPPATQHRLQHLTARLSKIATGRLKKNSNRNMKWIRAPSAPPGLIGLSYLLFLKLNSLHF